MNFSQPPGINAGSIVGMPPPQATGPGVGGIPLVAPAIGLGMGTSQTILSISGTISSVISQGGDAAGGGGAQNITQAGGSSNPCPAPPCTAVISRWVLSICCSPSGVTIYFRQDHKRKVISSIGCFYPTTTPNDYTWIMQQPSKGKAVWERFYYLPYYLVF